jgi:hypothetical protein
LGALLIGPRELSELDTFGDAAEFDTREEAVALGLDGDE